jgi:stearoyl-CoA desaturase (delta-9 desaturase)
VSAAVLREEDRRADWPVVFILVVMHLACAACFFVKPTGTALALFVGWFWLAGFGITIGFHRLLSHRAFECDRWLLRIWATLGTLALQGGPVFWAGLHRQHHQFSDREGDPHSPRERFLEGHILWMTRKETKTGAVLRALSARDLMKVAHDPYMKWLDRAIGPLVPWLVSVAVCYAIAGLPGLVWGGVARTVFGWHATWLVNSVAHRWGGRPHATFDDSRNVWWLAPIAFGDQWHNNHHAHPRAAVAGEAWWQLDPSGAIIVALEKLGLARNVQRARTATAETAAQTRLTP